MMTTEEAYKGHAWVETTYGHFSPANPVFDYRDIAHSLGQLARYNGHARRFYSVAEHSILVSQLVSDLDLGDPFEGLMHDATEAYLSDVPAPFKQLLPDFQRLDARMETALRSQYTMPVEKSAGVKRADWLALFIEAAELMPSGGAGWQDPHNVRPEALALAQSGRYRVRGWDDRKARDMFLQRFLQLDGDIRDHLVPQGENYELLPRC